MLAAVILGVFAVDGDRAQAHHRVHCDGEWCGYLFDCYGCESGCDCYACGWWHVSIKVETGEFNFHFHGDTCDSGCFNQRGDIPGWSPQWVANELARNCGWCIECVEKTHYSIDRKGKVFLKVTGRAYQCNYCSQCES